MPFIDRNRHMPRRWQKRSEHLWAWNAKSRVWVRLPNVQGFLPRTSAVPF